MDSLFIEDEFPAYKQLQNLLRSQLPNAQISEQIERISSALNKYKKYYQTKNQLPAQALQQLVQQMQRPTYRERLSAWL